jgi:hypothetical protein
MIRMLGDLFYTLKGKESNIRILDVKNGTPTIESTLTGVGKLKDGTEVTEIGTSQITIMPDGSMHGDHKGMMMTKDGSEMATDIVKGVGHRVEGGKLSFRGAVFTTTSSTGKLAFLNNMVGVFEYEQDESGNIEIKVWEWK